MMDDGNIDSNYLQFVVGLLDDTDNYSDYVGRERADSISEFLRRERADSITDFLKRERQDSITDFLPKQSDFLMRDRAYSWDLNMEEQSVTNDKARGVATAAAATANSSSSSSSSSSGVLDKKRKLDLSKAPAVNSKNQKPLVKSPPLPAKAGNKPAVPAYKIKPPPKPQPKVTYSMPENKYVPQKMMDSYNMEISKLVPDAMLGQQPMHPLTHTGQPHTLTRYDPFSAHLLDHAGLMPVMHPMDVSCPRVGAYTKEERQVIIAKFRAKKMRRVWRKQIKYDCRKRLADTRPRVKGRFVSRKEREGEQDEGKDTTGIETGSGDGDYEDE